MIPLCLVTGFLGAGKTTFLQRVIERYRDRKILYIVNEFSPRDIDGARLNLAEGELTRISGGSVFCKCKVTDFINVLKNAGALPGIEGVVIEASGIADPKVVRQMLRETRLDELHDLRAVVSVVDPGSFRKLVKTLPNIVGQIEAADWVIINKCDAYDAEALAETERLVREIKPEAQIVPACQCQVELDIFAGLSRGELAGEYAKCVDSNFVQVAVNLAGEVDWASLRVELDKNSGALYRVKGFVPTAGEMLSVDYSASGWEVGAAAGEAGLVIIGNGGERDKILELAGKIESGFFAA
jgi:G3E family GTPase